MSSPPHHTEDPPPPGWKATVAAALGAGLLAGLVFGGIDAIVADLRLESPVAGKDRLGCYAAAVMSYSVLAATGLVVVGLVLHPRLRTQCRKARLRRLLILGFAAGCFAELYWWTRPFVFPGASSLSIERLGVTALQAVVALLLGVVFGRLLIRLPGGAHAALRVLAALAIAGGLWFVASEASRGEARGAINERNRDLPNILLVIVDALRADSLGCYGNPDASTPNLDALAERGVLLEDCFAQVPVTLGSFGSILTGKYPRRHGLVSQEAGVRMQSHVTLAQHLASARRRAGGRLLPGDFASGAFMTGSVSHHSGLAAGFDVYSEAMRGHGLVVVDSAWSRFRSELLPWLWLSKLRQRVDSSLVVNTAVGWLRENRERRWMAMVHLYSTHLPYDPPSPHREANVEPGYDGPFPSFRADHPDRIEELEYEPTPEDLRHVRGLYAAEAAHADQLIGELLTELEELGVAEKTLVVVTADHGEDLGELRSSGLTEDRALRRYWDHNHMWQTNLRVPLVLANTRLLPHGRRVSELVETIDLLPTLCELLDLELPEESGRLEVDGRSFLPAILGTSRGEAIEWRPREFAFSENNLFLAVQDRRAKLIVPRRLPEDSDPEAVFREDVWVRYYDLERDPDEQQNAFRENPEGVRRLWTVLREWVLRVPQAEHLDKNPFLEEVRWLESLGYTDGVDPEIDSGEVVPEPEQDKP